MEEEKKPKGLDRYLTKLEHALNKTRRKVTSLLYPATQEGPEAQSDLKRISTKMSQEDVKKPPGVSALGSGVTLLDSSFVQVQQERQKEEQKPKLIKGAYTLVRQENAVSQQDLSIVNGFYKRVIVSGVAMLVHSGITLHFLYQSRVITYERFPSLYPRMQFVWYPSLIALYVVYVFYRHHKLIRRMDVKYTPLWLEIKQIYKERDQHKEREKAKL